MVSHVMLTTRPHHEKLGRYTVIVYLIKVTVIVNAPENMPSQLSYYAYRVGPGQNEKVEMSLSRTLNNVSSYMQAVKSPSSSTGVKLVGSAFR